MSTRFLATSVAFLMTGAALAQVAAKAEPAQDKEAASLSIGDKAPTLAVEKWVKGTEVKSFEKGKVYVVEFWATWCGPCIQVQPHLTDLQTKYKDKGLTIIGMTSEDPRNSLEKVEKMVADRTDKMGYSVAWDKGRTTNKAYMDAAGQNGIPCAFVVNQDGNVAYIGHPMGMDEPLEQIIAGKYDLKAAAAKLNAAKNEQKAMMEAQKAVVKFQSLLKSKEFEKAYTFAREAGAKELAGNAQALNAIAWTILDDVEEPNRSVDVALELAKKAVDLEKDDGMILDTLAYAHFQKGDHAKAVEMQRKAIELVKKMPNVNEDILDEMKGRLTKFEEKVKKNN